MTHDSISVTLPTYHRPTMLKRCLSALLNQTQPPCEIVVGRRSNDDDTAAVLVAFRDRFGEVIRDAIVGPADNLVASMNAALALTTGQLVALTDDDAEAPSDWLAKLSACFSDPTIGGVGGRDWQPHERWDELEVGVIRWWGKVIGSHHLGAGPPRDVDLLKGVNCCFRGAMIRNLGLDRRLRGVGNVSHWEMHLSFAFRRAGWRLVYDPNICLDHHVAPRLDGDVNARGGFDRPSFEDGVHNGALALLEHLPEPRRTIFRLWQFWIGTRAEPGVLQGLRLMILGMRVTEVLTRFRATRVGVAEAVVTLQAKRGRKAMEASGTLHRLTGSRD